MSTEHSFYVAAMCNDGDSRTEFNFCHTDGAAVDNWWRVDWSWPVVVARVVVVDRILCCNGRDLAPFHVSLLDSTSAVIDEHVFTAVGLAQYEWDLGANRVDGVSAVRVQYGPNHVADDMNIAEVLVYATMARSVRALRARRPCVSAPTLQPLN